MQGVLSLTPLTTQHSRKPVIALLIEDYGVEDARSRALPIFSARVTTCFYAPERLRRAGSPRAPWTCLHSLYQKYNCKNIIQAGEQQVDSGLFNRTYTVYR